jgi:hypothetical protein
VVSFLIDLVLRNHLKSHTINGKVLEFDIFWLFNGRKNQTYPTLVVLFVNLSGGRKGG